MATRKLHTQSIYLEPVKAELLDELAAETRIPKAALMREAIDLLLLHHGKLSEPSSRKLVREAISSALRVVNKYGTEARGAIWKGHCATAARDLTVAEKRMQDL
jgi:Ribbon-helix-helix domain